MRALRRVYQKGEPIPSKIWSLCNLASKALEPWQSEESLKAVSEVKQESERKDTQARNYLSAEEIVPHRSIKMLFQRTEKVRKPKTKEMSLLLFHQMKQI